MGNVLQAGLGQNPARQAALAAGLPVEVSCTTINKVCGSGLAAIVFGAQSIISQDAEVVVAGGMENMSRAPFLLEKARYGYRLGNGQIIDVIMRDGLLDTYTGIHMALTVENLAIKYGITRQEQDEFAFSSQKKCAAAIKNGLFKPEISPVKICEGKGNMACESDEFPRPDTSIEKLAALKPAFKNDGTITAGNASGINDGAAAVTLMAEKTAAKYSVEPMAEIISWASCGVEPSLMGLGPVPAIREALKRAQIGIEKIDLIEVNEAFAAQIIAVNRELGLNLSRLNVNGGAIALGHPIGASGARILVTLLHQMRRQKAKYGLAALCIGGGEGIAMVVKGR
jgi:acetyl-CoA C-acetyltransferase